MKKKQKDIVFFHYIVTWLLKMNLYQEQLFCNSYFVCFDIHFKLVERVWEHWFFNRGNSKIHQFIGEQFFEPPNSISKIISNLLYLKPTDDSELLSKMANQKLFFAHQLRNNALKDLEQRCPIGFSCEPHLWLQGHPNSHILIFRHW